MAVKEFPAYAGGFWIKCMNCEWTSQNAYEKHDCLRRPDRLEDALRRIRYIAGHKSTTPGSDYERIYEEATAALPAGDLLQYPDRETSGASAAQPPSDAVAPSPAKERP